MSVRIENFVDVKITRRAVQESAGAYDTAVYYSSNDSKAYYFINGTGNSTATGDKKHPKTIDQASENVKKFGTEFFANGGKKLHVIKSLTYNTEENCWMFTDSNSLQNTSNVDIATHLPVEEIVVFAEGVPDIATTNATLSGIEKKIHISSSNTPDSKPTSLSGKVSIYQNNAVSGSVDVSSAPLLAYYTNIFKNGNATPNDYSFTLCTFTDAVTFADPTDETAKKMIENKINFIAEIAGGKRAIGGDTTAEEDITNLFMQIVLQQTLTNALMKLLSSKIKLNTAGITSVKNAVGVELDKYVNYGYISTDKLWTEDDLYLDGELIAAKGSPLARGYVVHVSPITQENIKDHQIPTIYVLYGDSVGVRKIVVQGEVF